jgi:DNA (cytosine-5)-methyltransferase 1
MSARPRDPALVGETSDASLKRRNPEVPPRASGFFTCTMGGAGPRLRVSLTGIKALAPVWIISVSRLTSSPVLAILEEMGDSSSLVNRRRVTVTGRRDPRRELSHVTGPGKLTRGSSQLVLSLFPGIDLLGRGFESHGFSVVRGPDLIFGGDIKSFSAPAGRFDGVIAGSPCPDFSRARRGPPTGQGMDMLREFRRIVLETLPVWWLLENVPACPDVLIDGWSHQRIDIDAKDLGAEQRRLRHFQFGHRLGCLLCLARPSLARSIPVPTLLASTGGTRRDFGAFCRLQGLPADFDLPAFTLSAKYRAVGNGVHLEVARFIAGAVLSPVRADSIRLCACGCARPVSGKAKSAGPSCRKRLERKAGKVL